MPIGLALDHHLTGVVRARLEKHRVKGDIRLQPTGQRLQSLRAPNLAAVERDSAIIGHVLRLEGRDAHSASREQPTHAGDQNRLTGI